MARSPPPYLSLTLGLDKPREPAKNGRSGLGTHFPPHFFSFQGRRWDPHSRGLWAPTTRKRSYQLCAPPQRRPEDAGRWGEWRRCICRCRSLQARQRCFARCGEGQTAESMGRRAGECEPSRQASDPTSGWARAANNTHTERRGLQTCKKKKRRGALECRQMRR